MTARRSVAIYLGILLRATGSRRTSAVVLFLASAVAVAAAAIGPLFLRAGDLSILSSAFASAPRGQPALVVLSDGGAKEFAHLRSVVGADVRRAGGLLDEPTLAVDAGSFFVGAHEQPYAADVLARTDICAHLRFTQGRCPTALDDVGISVRSARAAGVRIGSRLQLAALGGGGTARVTVAGIYRQPSSVATRYWAGNGYFSFGTGKPGAPTQLDPLVGSFATALAYARVAPPQLAANAFWSLRAPFAGLHTVETTLRTAAARLSSDPALHASAGYAAVFGRAAAQARLMRSIVLAIVLQLVLLALVVLYTLTRATIAGRRAEAEFARRHGFTRRAMFALALGEPAVLIVAALPVGLLVAWLAVFGVGRSLFAAGTPVAFDVWSFVAAIAVCCAGVLAVSVASVGLWRREGPRAQRPAVAAAALDGAAVVLALAGLLALATQGSLAAGSTNAVAFLAPGLLALGAGVVALRLVLVLIASGIRQTRESPRIASFLALRELGRRPVVLRQTLPLVAAVTVCLFAVGAYERASSNRSLLAHFTVGAARVVDVSVRPGFDLVSAVRHADPSGRQAMAAVLYNSTYGRLLAVDSARLAAVATWPRGLSRSSVAAIAGRLAPTSPPDVLGGDAIRLQTAVPTGTPALSLALDLYDPVYGTATTLVVGPVEPGIHVYAASTQGSCATGCRVLSLTPSWERSNQRFAGVVRIDLLNVTEHRAGTWYTEPPDVTPWKAQPAAARAPRGSGAAVVFTAPGPLIGVNSVSFAPASAVAPVPAVVTSDLERINPPSPPGQQISLQDLDGNPMTVAATAVVPTLPQAGQNAALVDLRFAENELTGPIVDSTSQVWLSDSAGPAILSRLRAEGVKIGATKHASALVARLAHSGTAFGYDLMLIVAPIVALLALGTIMFGIVSDGRRRRGELLSLTAVGLGTRVVRRSLLLENLAVLVTAVVIGTGVGLAALALALPALPEFVSGSGGLPVPTSVPVVPVLEAAGVLALLFLLTATFTTRLVLTRRGGPA